MCARLWRLRAARAGTPPIASAQAKVSSQSATQSMEGVLMVSPRKMPSFSWLPPVCLSGVVMRKILGMGQGGV